MGGQLPQANPPPAYIAQSAAEHLTSTELDRPVIVSENALELVNGFLDQVLYNILSLSKSTNLDALRQTVPRLLRPRLGQAAISAAEEELRDYIEGEDADNIQQPPKLVKPSDFDLELAWKLARLRCMVYARLGDMEDEDEEEFLESERLEEHVHGSPMSVVPMSAIFLTSVLEFLGEQALCNAAQHSERRHNFEISKTPVEGQQLSFGDDELVVEQADMLQLGREGPLSRLWRTWRRESRSSDSFSSIRPITPGSVKSPAFNETSHSRKPSHAASPTHAIPEEDSPRSEPLTPAQIPIPIPDTDVDEIEVPGYARDRAGFPAGGVNQRPDMGPQRPSSLLIMPGQFPGSAGPSSPEVPTRSPLRPYVTRQRSNSLPYLPDGGQGYQPWLRNAWTPSTAPQKEQSSDQTDTHDEEASRELQTKPSNEQVSRPNTRGGSRPSAINGAAVAAIAGALGVEAARSRKEREQKEVARPETPRKRTVAEEIMGTSRSVVPPQGVDTRASITGPSDFETLNVPHEVQEDLDDDPEDLALSSGDERNVTRSHARRSVGSHASPVVPTSPASPRRNREARVMGNSIVSSPRDEPAEFGEELVHDNERPRTQESVTFEPSAFAHASESQESARSSGASDLPLQRPEEFEDSTPVLPNGAWTTSIPPRMSSREQPRTGHGTSGSTSQYSNHSKHSSSSSKIFGPGGQTLKDQRADFGDFSPHSRSASASTQKVIPGQVVGASPKQNLAARREHVRVRADSEDDAAKTRNLEVLIKSDETLHYTLTPESARAEEVWTHHTSP
jgi:hypothetical protein